MQRQFLAFLLLFILFLPFESMCDTLIFHESFEDLDSIQNNGGTCGTNGCVTFIEGLVGKAADFAGEKRISYPLEDHFYQDKGTVEFLINTPDANHLGFFDIGNLGQANTWGIYKNRDHIIMEVKNQNNSYDQAWSPHPISYDNDWHLVTAVWERQAQTTHFKVCFDGECKDGYDGLKDDSFPELSDQFQVGWCGWYGYSESAFDELKIFDYVKTDAEIYQSFKSYFPDNVRPIITINGLPSVVVDIGNTYYDAGASAYDEIDGDISSSITTTGSVDTTKTGTYRIAYDVSNSKGEVAKEKVRWVYVIDPDVAPVWRAFDHMNTTMDKYHKTFDVYTDFICGGNHGSASGWMGSIDTLEVTPDWDSNCYNGLTCFKNSWHSTAEESTGLRWLHPDGNWANVPDAGFNITGATKLTFYARGNVGGEQVEFLSGGVIGEHPDSIQPTAKTGKIQLTTDWKKYTLDVSGEDLTYVISPFGWTVDSNATFFIDDISYDQDRQNELRFIQSLEITDLETDIVFSNAAYVYDNALALLSFLARQNEDDMRRAKILADALLFALENDRAYEDYRLRNAYMSGDLTDPGMNTAKMPGWWDASSQTWFEDEFHVSTHTGNMAWAMIALLSFYEMQGGQEYLQAVINMAQWIEAKTMDDRCDGGYTAGYSGWEATEINPHQPDKLLYKSTEHNIDLYVLFTRLYKITEDIRWAQSAAHAKLFIDSMWNDEAGHFWTSTTDDGCTINKSNVFLDIQAWAVMAMPEETKYKAGLQWALSNCSLTMDGMDGFDFNNDLDGVWLEGTAQMVVAYQIEGDQLNAQKYIEELRKAQKAALNANGKGIVAASHDGVTTGFDWKYLCRLHIGATAWFIFAELKHNPYWGTCTNPDIDSDGDGTSDYDDQCPFDPNKTEPGLCGCGVADTDSDGDGIPDCNEGTPSIAGDDSSGGGCFVSNMMWSF